MRNFRMYQRVLGSLLGIQLIFVLPAYPEGPFANTGRRADAPYDHVSAPKGPITGTITDNNGKPVSGASIVIKGTKTGVTTDVNFYFSINAKQGDVLVVSIIGYKTREVRVGGQAAISLALEP